MSAAENKPVESIFGLSPLQSGMLFHALHSPDSGAYFQQVTALLCGELDSEIFRNAWLRVIERHGTLRCAFVWEKIDQPVQVVYRQAVVPIRELDWSEYTAADREARFADLLREERAKSFELASAPLMRLILIKEAHQRHRLLWNYHHLLLDGWSLAIVLREVFHCYASLKLKQPLQLQASRPYRDYIAWLKRQSSSAATQFWRSQLQGFREPTRLGIEFADDAQQSADTRAEVRMSLSTQTTSALRDLAQREHLTLNVLVQAAWSLVLSRYSGSNDVVYGATVSGRPPELPGAESMVGLLINTQPVRVRLQRDMPLLQWLQQLQTQLADLRQFEYSALSEIHAASDVAQAVALFDSILVFENYPVTATDLGEGPIAVRDLQYLEQTHYPLAAIVVPGERLSLGLAYHPTQLQATAVERMLQHFGRALEEIARAPERRLYEIEILDEHERALALHQPVENSDAPPLAHRVFESCAARWPDATAVLSDTVAVSYAQLDRQANQLAHLLGERGVAAEDRVAVCLERSAHAITGLFGIMKTGAAYVPLDPAYPQDLLRTVIGDARPAAVIVDSRTRDAMQGLAIPLIDLDADADQLAKQNTDSPISVIYEDNLAYIIYTSGSTGVPKGVMVPHGPLTRYTQAMIRKLQLDVGDRVLEFAPLTFDASIVQIFPALLSGATLCIQRDVTRLSNTQLLELCRQQRISVLDLPAGFWHQWLHGLAAQAVKLEKPLRYFLTGGETTHKHHLQTWQALAPAGSEFLSSYGPTETTVAAATFEARSGAIDALQFDQLPLGTALPHVGLYLLDDELRPVPPGMSGTLFVGGHGVSRGYLNQPALTAECFVPDPFASNSGARMYRTGDVARLLPDGRLEFRGRGDGQVKIRGYRIELSEIETALARHPAIRETLIAVHQSAEGTRSLVAYVVAAQATPPDQAELRSFLASRLPEYKIPTCFVVLEKFPLSRNGKIDREALPAPQDSQQQRGTSTAAQSEIENVLAEIWRAILEIETVGRHDSFFELGGHSLLATQLVSRIGAYFQVELPLADLFATPTLAAVAEKIQTLLKGGAARPSERITVSDRNTNFAPLAFAQRRLWFLDRLNPQDSTYNLPTLVRLSGALDVAALTRSLQALVLRHESLRTTFEFQGGEPLQRIHAAGDFELPLTDLRTAQSTAVDERVATVARDEGSRPFDLSRGPLFRAHLLRLTDRQHVLLLTLHHIVADGWSMGILLREVAALYAHFTSTTNEASALPELPIQYRDFAVWQNQHLVNDASFADSVDYWKRQLADLPDALQLPLDNRRPATARSKAGRERWILSAELTSALKTLGSKERVTLFMTLLAAFKTLLYRYSGQTDLIVGAPIAGRTEYDTEGLIGFFLNTLALRTRLGGGTSFRQLLKDVRQTALGAYAHQGVNFEHLLEILQPTRDASTTAVFQTMFNLQNFAPQRFQSHELELESMEPFEHWARVDLALLAEEHEDRLRLDFLYRNDLFEAHGIREMLQHLDRILSAAVADPRIQLCDIRLIGDMQTAPRLIEFNNDSRLPAEDEQLTVDAVFRSRVASNPEQLAVCDGERSWSYRRLDEWTNHIAHRMLEFQDARVERVALLLGHGALQAAAMLAALRCGKAYVPLDPEYPLRRLEHMLEDCGAQLLITEPAHRELADRLAAGTLQVIEIHPHQNVPAGASLPMAASPDSCAYILYTSGSTGRPKGVVQSQRNLLHHIRCYNRNLGVGPHDRLTQLPSYSFDAAVMDIFGALLSGATLYPFHVRRHGLKSVSEWLHRHSITIFHSTPTLYRYFLDTVHAAQAFPTLRLIVLGGEEVVARDVERYRERFAGHCVFVNGFGPTESTLCLQFPFTAAHSPSGTRVPIGYPVEHTQVLLLDEGGRSLADIGVGEIAIRSRYVALGYHGNAEQTQRAFLPDAVDPRIRTYRTGDIGRRRFDGAFEYLGRADAQLKIRGFRIETAEVEAALAEHPAVDAAVVVGVPDARGEKQLVAYFIGTDAQLSERALRRHLMERVPDYMVPSCFIAMAAFPLTPTGKIQRDQLPAPAPQTSPDATQRPPRDVVETLVATAWSEVLKRNDFSIDDNFFAIGGHSLLATQVIARLEKIFAVEIPLRTLFEEPTIEALAETIRTARGGNANSSTIPAIAGQREAVVSFSQQRFWFLNLLDPGNAAHTIPATVRLQGPLDIAVLQDSLNAIIARHQILRTTFHAENGSPAQRWLAELHLSIPLEDLSSLPHARREDDALQMAIEDAWRPFDLEHGPLLRARLLKLGDDEHLLLFAMHHIVGDGWSTGILVSELASVYRALRQGLISPLAPLPIQYSDFAQWQRQYLSGETQQRLLKYWSSQLAQPTPLPRLIDAGNRHAVRSNRGDRLAFELSPQTTAALQSLAHSSGCTLFMVLLAAFKALIFRFTGQEDFVVGSPIANRNRREVEPLIGCFVNTLPLRADLSAHPTFTELLLRTRQVALDAYAHQDLPFEVLVKELAPTRSSDSNPLFDVLFGMLDMPAAGGDPGDLRLERLDIDYGFAFFELSLFMMERDGRVSGTWLYSLDAYERAAMRGISDAYMSMLASLARDPHQQIEAVVLLDTSQREHVLRAWNDTAQVYDQGEYCLHQLINAQVFKTPHHPAVVFEQHSLTYAQLQHHADALALQLIHQGVGPETIVAVCAQRCVELVVALVAILKSGAAYLPLDPQLPTQRLHSMLEHSRARVVLTQDAFRERFDTGVIVLGLELRSSAQRLPTVAVQPAHPAYVIYTSGTTGQPKGVVIPHRGIVNRLLWMQEKYALDGHDRVLQKTPYTFDVSVWEFFWPLITGATVVLARPEGHRDPAYLADLIHAQRITTLHFVPSMLSAFVQAVPQFNAPDLRQVFCSGEALMPDQVEHWLRLSSAQLHNLYGPTEASVDVSFWHCRAEQALRSIPIGRPIANTQLYILDARGEPVPVGVCGELSLGGVGLARGYLNQPALTAERFVPDPFSSTPGARLYRTGDRARYLPEGAVEFLGRLDHQLKLRGFRIEPAEIEHALTSHPQVHQAVVVPYQRESHTSLVAYLVAEAVDAHTVREYLKQRLPEYMVPAQFVMLSTLPLTANGKLDRAALPTPERPTLERDYLAPSTEIERTLCEIWRQLLGIPRIGVRDNFFELGGDSILGVQMVARATAAGIRLTARQLFEHQHIQALATVAGRSQSLHAEQSLILGEVQLTPIQHWFFQLQQPRPQHWNQAVMLSAHQPLQLPVLQQIFNTLLQRHDALRHRFEPEPWRQVARSPEQAPLQLESEDLSALAPTEREAAIARAVNSAQRALDLQHGPMLAVRCLHWQDQTRLLIVVHHLLIDGVSWRILLDELQRGYLQLMAGQAASFAPKTTSFQYWAQRLVQHTQQLKFHDQLPYWLQHGRGELIRLPHPQAPNLEASVRTAHIGLDAPLTRQLLQEVHQAYNTTVQEVLLAALASAVLHWSEHPRGRLLIHMEGHGREEALFEDIDLSRTLGWFTTLYPLCLTLDLRETPGQTLKTVKETLRQVPDHGIGYGALRYLAEPDITAQLAAIPTAQLSFNYLGRFDEVLDAQGPFTLAPESLGDTRDPNSERPHLLDFSADISRGRLALRCSYSAQLHATDHIEQLMQLIHTQLTQLLQHCLQPDAGDYTPSDFPLAALDNEQLDAILADVEFEAMDDLQ